MYLDLTNFQILQVQIDEASDMEASDMEAVAVGNTGKFGEVWGGICFFQLLLNLGPGYTPHIGLLSTGALGNQTLHSDIFEV